MDRELFWAQFQSFQLGEYYWVTLTNLNKFITGLKRSLIPVGI